MTSQFENYVPIQDLPAGVEEISKAENTMTESVTVTIT